MSETFNGYHVWLGIPPNEQPPNHYRLLGIAAFETDLDVIDHAADRQMAHVRTFQAGRNAALSQRILNELAAARICLLHPERKAEYDGALRAKLPAGPQLAVPIGQAVPVAVPVMPNAAPRMPNQPAARVPAAQPAPAAKGPAKPAAARPQVAAQQAATKPAAAKPVAARQAMASPLEPDAYEVDGSDAPLAERVDDDAPYTAPESLVSAGKTLKLTRKRSFGSDDTLQRAFTYVLVAVAAIVVISIGVSIFRKQTAHVKWGELLTQPHGGAAAPLEPIADPNQPQAPPPPTPGQHTETP